MSSIQKQCFPSISSENKSSIKMIEFIPQLYKKYKLLSKLTEEESTNFQEEIVNLLTDQNQNVDHQAYQQILTEIGLATFILQVLANVINRNSEKCLQNKSKMLDDLQKKQCEFMKKNKALERKQDKIHQLETNIMQTIRQKCQHLEKLSFQKILNKESEIKKSINLLLNQLKGKQKLLIDKEEQIKIHVKRNQELDQKDKIIVEKTKVLEKRQKQIKNKENEILIAKKQQASSIKQLQMRNDELTKNLKQTIKKLKNLDLAYKKLKNDLQKRQSEDSNKKEDRNKKQEKPKQLFEKLQLSKIQISPHFDDQHFEMFDIVQKENNLNQSLKIKFQTMKSLILQLITFLGKSEKIIKINHDCLSIIKQLKQIIFEQKYDFKQNSATSEENYEVDESKQQELALKEEKSEIIKFQQKYGQKSFDFNANMMSTSEVEGITDLKRLMQFVLKINIDDDQEKERMMSERRIDVLVQKCMQNNLNREITLLTLDVMLGMFQRSSLYDKIIDYFHRNEKIVYFLQQSYLLHETFDEITETSTLILSRMALSTTDQPLHLQKPFLNAIKIRMKILDTHQLLYNNIKSIIG